MEVFFVFCAAIECASLNCLKIGPNRCCYEFGYCSLPRPGKPHTSLHSRSHRAFLSRCFLPLYIQGYFLQLLLVKLLHCFLDRADGEEQISVSLLTVLRDDTGWFCSDEPSIFQHPHIFSYCAGAHSSGLPNGFETRPALISISVLAEK